MSLLEQKDSVFRDLPAWPYNTGDEVYEIFTLRMIMMQIGQAQNEL